MERGVEAGDLQQVRAALHQRANGREIVWLMQWREGGISLQTRQYVAIHHNRMIVFGSAVHHAVARGDKAESLAAAQPVASSRDRRGNARDRSGLIGLVDELLSVTVRSA